jgi:hypothetical protein
MRELEAYCICQLRPAVSSPMSASCDVQRKCKDQQRLLAGFKLQLLQLPIHHQRPANATPHPTRKYSYGSQCLRHPRTVVMAARTLGTRRQSASSKSKPPPPTRLVALERSGRKPLTRTFPAASPKASTLTHAKKPPREAYDA